MSTTLNLVSDLSMGENSTTNVLYESVIDMLETILQANGLPAVYMANVKNFNVRGNILSAVFVMESNETTLYWHNWANLYNFQLQIYDLRPSNSRTIGFSKYDEAIQRNLMYEIIGTHLANGGTVVGYNATSNWAPMKQKRGITYVEYSIKILVVY